MDGFGRISYFLRGLVDSDLEVVASLSLCCHARRQQRQWHYFTGFCLSSCTSAAFPTIAARCSGGVMPQIMDIVMVSCDVELIVASCHRSWGHREGDVAFSSVEQIVVPAVMDVPVIMQRRCVATLDVPQIQFIARVYRHSISQCNGSAGFGGDVGAFRGSSTFFVLLLLEWTLWIFTLPRLSPCLKQQQPPPPGSNRLRCPFLCILLLVEPTREAHGCSRRS